MSPLNVVCLISGGKDSLFSILHCKKNGHNVVALANLHPPRVDGQVAVVTGATLGIGLAYAEGLASAGIKQLILTFRSQATLDAAISQIKQFNPDVIISSIHVDFLAMPEDEIIALIYTQSYAKSTTGIIDILINNAGINERHPVESFPQDGAECS